MSAVKNNCLCGEGEFIVLSCSGASDVGELSDRVARKLADSGVRKMNCLSVVGAGIKKSIDSFRNKNILVIDGCRVDCGHKSLLKEGLNDHLHLRLTDLGYVKGKTRIEDKIINEIVEKAQLLY